jgi:hypothetical protein
MSLAVPSKLRTAAALSCSRWLALSLAWACFGCDPNFSPDWHPALPDAGQPPGDAEQPPVDVGSGDAAMPPAQDPDAASLPMYSCRIEYCDGGIPGCQTLCLAPSREVNCRVDEPCPYFGSTWVDCNLCMTPPIK